MFEQINNRTIQIKNSAGVNPNLFSVYLLINPIFSTNTIKVNTTLFFTQR